jgi:hypothetical protein
MANINQVAEFARPCASLKLPGYMRRRTLLRVECKLFEAVLVYFCVTWLVAIDREDVDELLNVNDLRIRARPVPGLFRPQPAMRFL